MASKKNSGLPSAEQISEKKSELSIFIKDVVDGKEQIKGQRETVTDKLIMIQDELALFKNSNISYSAISQILKDKIGLKVSDQTIRKFCQDRLGFEKKVRKSNNKKSTETPKADVKNNAESEVGLGKDRDFK